MKEKLQLLMEQLQLKPGQFARILDINPAIISHILAERNKPGVELLQKILSRFPQVSPDWLLLNSGEMFRSVVTQNESSMIPSEQQDNFTQQQKIAPSETEHTLFAPDTQINQTAPQSDNVHTSLDAITKKISETKTVVRVVLCYADKTFESFTPDHSEQS